VEGREGGIKTNQVGFLKIKNKKMQRNVGKLGRQKRKRKILIFIL